MTSPSPDRETLAFTDVQHFFMPWLTALAAAVGRPPAAAGVTGGEPS